MLGVILLLIAIFLFFYPRFRYLSYFLYLSFMMKGLQLWTDSILGVKDMDLAVIYTFAISAYLVFTKQWKIPRWPIREYYIAVILAVTICVLFSFVHYGLSAFQILQGGRNFLLLFSLPILIRIKKKELSKVLKLLLFFCVVTSILYILQIALRRPMMPYGEFSIDQATGLPRFYNSPSNLIFFLALTFLMPNFFKGKVWIYQILFFAATVCTLGRTYIITTITTIFLALLFQGKLKRLGIAIAAVFIILTPFMDVISNRFEGAGGTSDYTDILNGNYRDYSGSGDGGTMVYRFAWVYERWDYMTRRPISELFFGLGLVSDGQPWALQHYNFKVGLFSEDINDIAQLATPDISYGNLLTKLGLLGGLVYLAFAISLTIFLYKEKKDDTLVLLASATMITAFLNSFSGTTLSEPRNFALIFMIMSLLLYKGKTIGNESRTH